MPLSLLAITPEVQHMLEALGVRTLGEFAALPAPSVSRPLEADYQALARGDSGSGLRPYSPEAPIREAAVISATTAGPAAIALLADRVGLRLRGRARGAARLELSITAPAPAPAEAAASRTPAIVPGEVTRVVPVTPAMAPLSTIASNAAGTLPLLDSAESLAEAIGKALGDDLHTATRLQVTVIAEAVAGDAMADATAAETSAPPIDVLGVVLGTTGALGTWQLTSPASGHGSASALRSERRDAHRRTRASRAHRSRSSARAELVQPRLFADRK
jgi:hypothetical protein